MLKRVTAEVVRVMAETGVTPEEFFTMESRELRSALGLRVGEDFGEMEREEALFRARKEMEQIRRHKITPHFLLDDDYPVRLSQVPDAPVVVYKLGQTNLDSLHVVDVVGTRKPTAYGLEFSSSIVKDLAGYFPDLVVVSGLAYGIDASAHRAAIEAGVPTVAVVAHGLDMIYPAQHRDLARTILASGGAILSEYPFGERPFRQRFLERNRIVAGLSDVTIVAESDLRGGAMSTANIAASYGREVMALPGKISDRLSSGCNHLIRKDKARILTGAADVIEQTGWKPMGMRVKDEHRNLFPELDGNHRLVYDAIRFASEPIQVDRIHMQTLIPVAGLMAVLGELEFDGIVVRHPGNRYSLA